MSSWRVFVPSTPNRCMHLVLARLGRLLQVRGLTCLPPRCGTEARAIQSDKRSANELCFRNVPPLSATLSFFMLLPSGSTFGVGPLVVD
jgi:hypothetical protein